MYDLSLRDPQLSTGVRRTLGALYNLGHRTAGSPITMTAEELRDSELTLEDIRTVLSTGLAEVVDARTGETLRPQTGILSKVVANPTTGHVGFILAVNLVT